jgi:hypothetical protein
MNWLDIAVLTGAACGFVAAGMELQKLLWRKRLADLEHKASGYRHLLNQIGTVERWMDGESAKTAQWLRENVHNYLRKLGEPALLGLPPTIERFRDFILTQRAK